MILHIVVQDKFIPPFIDFLEKHFPDFSNQHVFFVESLSTLHPIKSRPNVLSADNYGKWGRYVELQKLICRADKIILHGLWNYRVVQLLALQPWRLQKCYWIIWGGDLYLYKIGSHTKTWWLREKFRRFVINRIGHLVTYFDGEYELAKKWYGASGAHEKSFIYPSNVFKSDLVPREKRSAPLNIQVGNSATDTNRHFEILEKLAKYKNDNIKIYAPLSYGDEEYAQQVAEYGMSIFGKKFEPLFDFMPYIEYLHYLKSIDIAVFNHNRQQGVGNIITLLGMGKTVYMDPEITSWEALCTMGLHVLNVKNLGTQQLTPLQVEENIQIISNSFSEAQLIAQLHTLFKH